MRPKLSEAGKNILATKVCPAGGRHRAGEGHACTRVCVRAGTACCCSTAKHVCLYEATAHARRCTLTHTPWAGACVMPLRVGSGAGVRACSVKVGRRYRQLP